MARIDLNFAETIPWIKRGVPAVVLAPMEGVADAPMRAFLTQLGGYSYCVGEFVRISNSVPGVQVFWRHVPELTNGSRTAAGVPVQVQILGGDPTNMAESALVAIRAGAQAVDINFGCPARTVNLHDGGASLLQYPARIRAIVAAVRKAVPSHIPVSAKLRLGWDDLQAIHTNADRAAAGGASWITIHGRTKEQGYRPPAYWEPIGEVRARLNIPVVANGEIWTMADFRRCRDETGCEHFMLGRGALANPSLAREAAWELGISDEGRGEAITGTPTEWLPLVRGFVELSLASGRTSKGTLSRVKQWLGLANHDGNLAWVEGIRRLSSLEEMLERMSDLAGLDEADLLEPMKANRAG